MKHEILVCDDLAQTMLIGVDFLKPYKCAVDFEKVVVRIKGEEYMMSYENNPQECKVTDKDSPIKIRRIPFHKPEIVREEIKDMIDSDVIEPSNSPWSAPAIVLVKKKDGTERFCVDYQKLKAITRKDVYLGAKRFWSH